MFDVSISVESDKVSGSFLVDSYFFEPLKYEYAFYLYRDGERVDTVWYSNSMAVSFDINGKTGLFFIKVFIKDIENGNTRTFDSGKMSINI